MTALIDLQVSATRTLRRQLRAEREGRAWAAAAWGRAYAQRLYAWVTALEANRKV